MEPRAPSCTLNPHEFGVQVPGGVFYTVPGFFTTGVVVYESSGVLSVSPELTVVDVPPVRLALPVTAADMKVPTPEFVM